MSTLHTLQSRLKQTSNALNETKPLIDRLRNFTHAIGQGDEARLELGAEIHSRLKNVEDEMEILTVEVEGLDVAGGQTSKRKMTGDINIGEKEAERKRIIGIAERLSGDLRRSGYSIGLYYGARLISRSGRERTSERHNSRQIAMQKLLAGKNENCYLRDPVKEPRQPREPISLHRMMLWLMRRVMLQQP